MKVHAKARFIRISPRKTRLVIDLIRGKSIDEARRELQFSRKAAAEPVLKVLNSAIANAENNFKLDTSNFRVIEAFVDEGPTIHRSIPRAQGRATPIRKRMSHITVAVGTKDDLKSSSKKVEKKVEEKKVEEKKPVVKKTVKKVAATKKVKKTEVAKEEKNSSAKADLKTE